jgi:hypothetical protein
MSVPASLASPFDRRLAGHRMEHECDGFGVRIQREPHPHLHRLLLSEGRSHDERRIRCGVQSAHDAGSVVREQNHVLADVIDEAVDADVVIRCHRIDPVQGVVRPAPRGKFRGLTDGRHTKRKYTKYGSEISEQQGSCWHVRFPARWRFNEEYAPRRGLVAADSMGTFLIS